MDVLRPGELCQGVWYSGRVTLRGFWACPPFSVLLSSFLIYVQIISAWDSNGAQEAEGHSP